MAPNPELSYLGRVILEIIETERTYVRDLRSIVEDYLAHIIDTADLPVAPDQVCALFGNIEDIYEFNSELLQELDQCANDPVAVARCFVLKSDYFEIYSQYCTNYPNSVAALTECMRNKTLLQFFMERQEVLKHPLPLGSYLLKPVQRILKYHLLLQEIAKHFDPDGDGYDVVEEAISTMTEVAWYINTMKRKHEHAVRLQEVQSLLINWRGPDLTTYGELVLEGTFRFHHARNDRTLFLLEQVLLITKRRGENFIYKSHITCATLMLMEGTKDSPCFSITHYKHPKHPHIVQARTMEEKKLWTHHIKRLILETHPTVIPQKAKDVILEVDSSNPKSRFNADRRKKTHSDDFSRQSAESNRQTVKSNKAVLKDAERRGGGGGGGPPSAGEQSPLSDCQNSQQASPREPVTHSEGTDLRSEDPALPPSADTSPIREQDHSVLVDQLKEEEPANPNREAPSSEEEEEEEGDGSGNHSILPSSVLDKAGVIAEHFGTAGRRRSSGATDEPRSPRQARPQDMIPFDTSPRELEDSEPERRLSRRRDYTLSRQERLVIQKIRSYYESAEQQDAAFSLKRRESLTYIPHGLVRSSVTQFNNPPPIRAPSPENLPHHTHQEHDLHEETFRPSSEMIKVWQDMEREVTRSPRAKFRETSRFRRTAFTRQPEPPEPAEDLSTITEESPGKVFGSDEGKNKRSSADNNVFNLAKKFGQHSLRSKPVNHTRRRSSESLISTCTPSVRAESRSFKGSSNPKPNGHMTPYTAHPPASSSISRVLSPEGSLCKSPLPVASEGFHWPDVRELRSKYTRLERGSLTLDADLRAADGGAARVLRTGSLDQRLPGFSWSEGHSMKVKSEYYVSAQAQLPNNCTITVLEKLSPAPSHAPSTEDHVQVRSPTSRHKIFVPSVSERRRAYQNPEEPPAFRTEPELRAKRDRENRTDPMASPDKPGEGTQQGVVKNLSQKFNKLG